jgi:hypothetical protein
MTNPWEFGWTQLFTAVGLVMTAIVSIVGLRTFGKYRKEKLEERRIEAAIDALALMYESKFIFEDIRSGITYFAEWDDMPVKPGEQDAQRNERGGYYAIWKRTRSYKEFFERAWKLQVRCAAIFGFEMEEVFLLLQKARREIEVAAETLARDPVATNRTPGNIETWKQFHDVVWMNHAKTRGKEDEVGKKLTEFQKGIKKVCRPIVNKEYRDKSP